MRESRPEKAGMRNVTSLGAVSFFTDFSTEMVLGVLPLFIIANLGTTRAILGAIEVFVVAGYALSTASKPFFAFAGG